MLIGLADVAFVRSTFEVFVTEAKQDLAAIDDAVSRRDFEAMRAHSHRIQGSASMLGASELQALCEQVNYLAKKESYDQVPDKVAAVHEEFGKVITDIEPAISEAQLKP
jgi:HPt (histidine-containing phosphotransfer) domain-containing protein